MEEYKDTLEMLNLIISPSFCVKDNCIVKVNQAASRLFLTEGTDISSLILAGKAEYSAFTDGCLYLTLDISGQACGASVTRIDDQDVFVIDQSSSTGELQVLSLAARELRRPLNAVMLAADQLTDLLSAPAADDAAARLNRSLAQVLRIIGNMSDADSFASNFRPQNCCIDAVVREVMEKASVLTAHAGVTLTYEPLAEQIICLADPAELERAVLNILSNSLKFTGEGGSIHAALVRRGRMLYLSITDSGSGIPDDIRSTVFNRYHRRPALEDSRCGIGLGLVMVRAAASHHGGAVLIDHPENSGTRVTMTMAIRQGSDNSLRSPVLRVDYTGEHDHSLVELSESLPHTLYTDL